MNTKFASIALIVASGLLAGTAAFADVTREQVKDELAAATRSGNLMADGESSLKLNELYPNRYPAEHAQATFTREQVKKELAAATRSGDLMAGGENGLKFNAL